MAAVSFRMLDASLLHPERPRPLRRAEYERLVALGAFEDERVELLHGVLVDMSPNKPGHVSPIDRLTMILVPALVGRAIVRVQSPMAAGDESEPEPDLAVVPPGDYRQEHPAHALLVIEVALSSLNKDRHVKAPLYAASGFLEYWIVDVAGQAVEVHAAPADGVYARVTRHGAGDTLRPAAFPDLAVRVGDVFA
jgi:Uma2 family endonuclease